MNHELFGSLIPGVVQLEAFHAIKTPKDAELQIAQAVRFIRSQAGPDSARLFAYPYGHVSDYLAYEYLPKQRDVLAAFTTEGKPWLPDCDPWRIPRYVCGWHFRSEEELRSLLAS